MEDISASESASSESGMELRKRHSTIVSTDDIVDPDFDFRDTLVSKSANISDDEDEEAVRMLLLS